MEEKASAFYARLVKFGWLPLTEAPPECPLYLCEGVLCYPSTICWDVPYQVIRFRGVDIPLNITTINEELEMSKVSNLAFEDKLREMDLEWLRATWIPLKGSGFLCYSRGHH